MFFVYRYIDIDTNECLYVGKTKDLYKRHSTHLCNSKEEWCHKDLKLEYRVLPDRYNMDFYEIYMINKLNPKYNVVGQQRMDISNIHFTYSSKWESYSKDKFLKEFIEKNGDYGISYDINQDILDIVSKWDLTPTIKISKKTKYIHFTFKEEEIIKYIDKFSYIVLDVRYKCIGVSGGCSLISFEKNYGCNGEYEFILRLEVLKNIESHLLKPDEDLKLLSIEINKFIYLMGIERSWNEIYDTLMI